MFFIVNTIVLLGTVTDHAAIFPTTSWANNSYVCFFCCCIWFAALPNCRLFPWAAPNASLSRYANQPMKKYSNTVVSRAYLQCLVIWIIVLQCNSTLATFTFFVISVLQCFPALFHCFANHVLLFQKYKFHSFMFVSQGFAKFHKWEFRKVLQIQVLLMWLPQEILQARQRPEVYDSCHTFWHVERVRKHTGNVCNSSMAVCFLTHATCKNVWQNLIPRATAYYKPQTHSNHSGTFKRKFSSGQAGLAIQIIIVGYDFSGLNPLTPALNCCET